MTIDKGIIIKNIYIMLSYAFQELRHNNYECIQKQKFDNILDLLAEILYRGISKQLKQGLHREYVSEKDSLSTIRGKINISETIHNLLERKRLIGCEFDDLSENNIFNRILKTTIFSLIHDTTLSAERKRILRQITPYFNSVKTIQPSTIQWQNLTYKKDNATYEMLMNICYFILENLLLTTDNGTYKMPTFTEQFMPRLFEHFVLEYYRRNHPALKAHADRIPWNITNEDTALIQFLPNMKSDITLHAKNRTLIIDTKYYSKALVQNMNKNEIRSGHLYQIFSYVKNRDISHSGNVSGLLLYAKTDENISPDLEADFDGNHISVRTLDLNCDFNEISKQLDIIADSFLLET